MKPGDLRIYNKSRCDAHICLPSETQALSALSCWSFLELDDVVLILETGIKVKTLHSDGTEYDRIFVKFLSSKGILYRFSDYFKSETEPLITLKKVKC